jgi:hypothetical protein
MNQTITVPSKTMEEIFVRLNTLTSEIKAIKAKLFEKEPPYGTDEWWKWSEIKADEDIKANRLIRFDSVNDAVKWLNS